MTDPGSVAVDLLLDAPDPAIVRAHGQLVALMAVILDRAGVAPVGEFAQMMTLYAKSIASAEPVEGAILSVWADVVRQLAAGGSTH